MNMKLEGEDPALAIQTEEGIAHKYGRKNLRGHRGNGYTCDTKTESGYQNDVKNNVYQTG